MSKNISYIDLCLNPTLLDSIIIQNDSTFIEFLLFKFLLELQETLKLKHIRFSEDISSKLLETKMVRLKGLAA